MCVTGLECQMCVTGLPSKCQVGVKEVSGSPSSIEEKEKEEIGIFLVRALYPYFARTEDDLSFEAGDKIEVRTVRTGRKDREGRKTGRQAGMEGGRKER